MEKEIILCDTNIFINWFNNHIPTIEKIDEIGVNKIALSVVTYMELIEGTDNKQQLKQLKKKIKNYYLIDFTKEISLKATELIEDYYLSHGLLIPDAIIGATAIETELSLFTYNTKDFKYLPGITLLD